ncbi:hypothetical protein [Marinicellulosiphila megalodicopiae]|uniref:hypothetical protein n=1 Tax=Marinicellulosiphila megalodicopiae TaxID=2724896 RepID=UPI003BAF9F45
MREVAHTQVAKQRKQDIQVNEKNYQLRLAVEDGDLAAAEAALAQGANGQVLLNARESLYSFACRQEDSALFDLLVAHSVNPGPIVLPKEYNREQRYSESELKTCLNLNHLDRAEQLLKLGFDPNWHSRSQGRVIGDVARDADGLNAVKLLVKYGAEINYEYETDVSFPSYPMEQALERSRTETFKYLLTQGGKLKGSTTGQKVAQELFWGSILVGDVWGTFLLAYNALASDEERQSAVASAKEYARSNLNTGFAESRYLFSEVLSKLEALDDLDGKKWGVSTSTTPEPTSENIADGRYRCIAAEQVLGFDFSADKVSISMTQGGELVLECDPSKYNFTQGVVQQIGPVCRMMGRAMLDGGEMSYKAELVKDQLKVYMPSGQEVLCDKKQ